MNRVWRFGRGTPAPAGVTAAEVGNKAWHLMQLADAGLPVPPGFVLETGWGSGIADDGERRRRLREVLAHEVRALEGVTGRTFGGGRHPLLLAVRSGAPVSMPGMMDTVLDVGLGDAVLAPMRRDTGNPRLCWDSYRRLVEGFGSTVLGVPSGRFAQAMAEALATAGVPDERELDVAGLAALTRRELAIVAEVTGAPFPQDPLEQLVAAVDAVIASWRSERAEQYRRMQGLADRGGTAVTVQRMVFGNRGGNSGSGVGFTRDPATGAPGLYLDFLLDAQGEDVVSGRRTAFGADALARRLPAVHAQLERLAPQLERRFGDAQDFEFTVERGELWLLQSRAAKRTPLAELRVAVDLVEEGLIDVAAARARLAHLDLSAITVERLVLPEGTAPLARGTAASPGVVSGPIALDAESAVRSPVPAILVRPDTSTDDLAGMGAAAGVLTAAGSRTSHAAVVARQLGRPCVVGCGALSLDLASRRVGIGDLWLHEGDVVSIDGTTGMVWRGTVQVQREAPAELLEAVRSWSVDEHAAGPSLAPAGLARDDITLPPMSSRFPR